jgi:anti-sigma B factor antagonist
VRENDAVALALPVIVMLPAEIDIANAGKIGGALRSAFRPGVTVVIADMTSTVFCGSSGFRSLLLANDEALARHAELRLATQQAPVLRALKLLGLGRVLQVYPTLAAALAAT